MIRVTKPFRDKETKNADGSFLYVKPMQVIKRTKKREQYLIDAGFAVAVDEPKKAKAKTPGKENKDGKPKKTENK